MDLYKILENLLNRSIKKKTKIILMIIYAIIMFTAIQSKMNIIIFILLFAVVPFAIYFFVKSIFPKD